MNRWLRVIFAVVLTSFLVACSANTAVPNKLIKKAIAIQVTQTQQELSQQLRLDPPKVNIDRIQVSEQDPLTIQGLQTYRVKGTYDFTLKLPKRKVTERDNPFEVYLQRQIEGKTWRLAQRDENGVGWVTQLIE